MKRAFMSELAIVRTLIPSIAGVGLFIFVVLTLANASDGDSGMSAGACALHFIELLLCSVQRGAEFEGLFRQGRTFRLRLIDFFFQPVNLRIQTF